MTQFLRDCPIRTKLTLLMAMAVATALLLACTVFFLNEVRAARNAKVQQLSELATMLAANTAPALEFDEAAAAEQGQIPLFSFT